MRSLMSPELLMKVFRFFLICSEWVGSIVISSHDLDAISKPAFGKENKPDIVFAEEKSTYVPELYAVS